MSVSNKTDIEGGEHYQQSGEVFPINSSGLVAPIWTGRSLQISEISVSTCRISSHAKFASSTGVTRYANIRSKHYSITGALLREQDVSKARACDIRSSLVRSFACADTDAKLISNALAYPNHTNNSLINMLIPRAQFPVQSAAVSMLSSLRLLVLFMAIVGAITTVIVTIFDVIMDILCCRCGTGRHRAGTRRGWGGRRGGATSGTY
ncbi:hypothetical protein CPB85DRAFT_1477922 [Mucidula mucida]|nr:hypothetical protein CPB85DRAFT_1477922 [Mucidula mucida]